MKAIQFAAGALFALSLNTAFAEKVRIEELPSDVQAKIRSQVGSRVINDVDRMERDGKTTYEVGYRRFGTQRELLFDEQGNLLNSDGTPVLDSRKMSWNDLPAAVRRTARSRTREGNVNDIDRQVKNGEVTYEIGFKHENQQHELLISQDGKILRDVNLPQELVSGLGRPAGSETDRQSSKYADVTSSVRLSGAEKVDRRSVPAAVERTITDMTRGTRVEDIERGSWRGQTVYQIAFKDNGRHIELQIDENGEVVHDPRTLQNTNE